MWSKLTGFLYSLPNFAVNLIIFALALLIGIFLQWLLNHYIKGRARKDLSFSIFRSIFSGLTRTISFFLPFLLLSVSVSFMVLGPVARSRLDKLSSIVVIVVIAAIMITALNIGREYVYHQFDLNKTDNLRERKIRTQLQFIRRIIIALIVFVSMALILLSFESFRRIGAGLLTGVGVGGIIIGFAAQKSLSNLLAGFQIAFTQPIRLDDVLVVEGQYGRVEEITLTYVVLSIWDERRLILPINYFIEKPFENWTRTTSELLGTAFFYLDFSAPVDTLKAEFVRLLATTELWDGRVGIMHVTNFTEHTVELRALMSAKNSSETFDLRCYIRERMLEFIQHNYPSSFPKTRAELEKNFPST